jgi:hypothetical protein
MGCDGVKTIRSGTIIATITATWKALQRTRLAGNIGRLPPSESAISLAYARHAERFSKERPVGDAFDRSKLQFSARQYRIIQSRQTGNRRITHGTTILTHAAHYDSRV